ncbi:MAG: FecR domain-containing protein [Rhodospirillaceae bacterium]|jgi:ferric-dicitrate binding protein FerR (iron transport regulator)|nr:FecR domain-containing protein [Rhodospirillaceae bacterium]MBT4937868.1 FecR domain-containing protein [Rhodospirillaceae bacterium]MBT5939925.1 FecR domain-containing protein [Rhodospirillaceae bacterium]MBT7267024.1 FecR domain-containing protein [Rhodospirillaceae bacterium]
MYRKFSSLAILGVLVVIATLTTAASETDEVVGSVSKLQGSAIAMQDAVPRILKVAAPIMMGDVISTGKDSRVELKMIDEAQFNLGARTNFVVEEYFLMADRSNAAIRLLSGAVGIVSGKIASLDSKPFVLRTATATIGVRGTTFWGGEIDGSLQFALIKGKGITVANKAGSVEITGVGQGTNVPNEAIAPTTPKKWGQGKLDRAAAMTSIK